MTPFDRAHTRVPLGLPLYYVTILHHFWRTLYKWNIDWRMPVIMYSTSNLCGHCGWLHSNFARIFGSRKYKISALSWLSFARSYFKRFWQNSDLWQMKGWRDGLTHDISMYHTSTASCGNNSIQLASLCQTSIRCRVVAEYSGSCRRAVEWNAKLDHEQEVGHQQTKNLTSKNSYLERMVRLCLHYKMAW